MRLCVPLMLLLAFGATACHRRPELPQEEPATPAPLTAVILAPPQSEPFVQFEEPEPEAPAAQVELEETIPTIEDVRSVLSMHARPRCGNGFIGYPTITEVTILKWGSRTFPFYEQILTDPASEVYEVIGACDAIALVKVNRRRFIPVLVHRLTDCHALVHPGVTKTMDDGVVKDHDGAEFCRKHIRMAVIWLLETIGSEQESIYIRPFFHHDDVSLRYTVLSALAKLGGQDDLDMLNTWLCTPPPWPNIHLIRRVEKARDAIDARLKANPPRLKG